MSRPSGKLKRVSLFAAILTTAALVLSGCGGSDGAQGPAGPAGPAGPTGPSAVATVKANALSAEQWGALSLLAGLGQFATGWLTVGQVIFARYGYGQTGAGTYLWTATRHDPEAVALFR